MPPAKNNFACRQTGKLAIFVAIFILVLGLLLSGYLFLKTKTGAASINQQLYYLLSDKTAVAENEEFDDDGDGLKNWEEKIHRTDPEDPDTDGDGYFDGEEATTGYDPTKKAPDDQLADKNPQNPRPLPKNLTKAMSLKITEGIFKGRIRALNPETGEPLTSQELEQEPGLQEAIEQAVSQQLNDFYPPAVSNQALNVSPTTGPEATLDYFMAISDSIAKIGSFKKTKSEGKLISEAIKTRNFRQLEQVQKFYQDGYKALAEATVPADLVNFHKQMMDIFWITNNIYTAIRNSDEDPLKAMIALQKYEETIDKANDLTAQVIKQIYYYHN